nr:PREDICTED: uncharacterized protein LOC109030605 [Bemisia tabaci]
MEFDSRLLEVKAALEQSEVKMGVKLKSFVFSTSEGTKNQINLLVESLSKIKLMANSDEEDKRRFHLFLLVNTELPVSNILEEDRDWCHLIGRCPKLSAFTYFIVVHRLELFPLMAESILHAPNKLSEALLAVFTDFVKHISDPYDELSALRVILTSAYKKLSYKISLQSCNAKLIKQFQEILLIFKKPSQLTAQKLVSWSSVEQHKYYGFLVLNLISLLLECTKFSFEKTSAEDSLPESLNNLYGFSSFKVSSKAAEEDENEISECYEVIVAISKTFLQEKISSIVFLDWCEVDITETKTLQRLVGEKIYICREALTAALDSKLSSKNLKNSLKDLTYCLSHLEIKPLSLAEEMKEMNFKQLLLKFDETVKTNSREDSSRVLQTILKREEAHLEPVEIMKVLNKAAANIKYEDIKLLIHTYNPKSSQNMEESFSQLQKTIFESVRNLQVDEQVSLLEEYLVAYGDSQPYNKQSINFDEKLVEVFNKFVSSDLSSNESLFLSDIVFLSFYSIGDVVVKILMESLQNMNYIKDMVPILKALRPSLQSIQSLSLENKLKIISKISEDSEKVKSTLEQSHKDLLLDLLHILIFDEDTKQNAAKRSNLLDLVNYLIDESVIERNTFYVEVVLNNIYLSPNTSNATVNFLLQMLFKALVESSDESLEIEINAVVIQLAQLLEKIRWDPKNFASWRTAMVSNLVCLISSIVKKFSSQLLADPKKSAWMKSYIKTFSVQTQFLFSPEILPPSSIAASVSHGKEPNAFVLALNAMHNDKFDLSVLSKISKIEMAWALFSTLSTSCDEEWNLFSLTLSRNKLFNGESALLIFNLLVNSFLVGIYTLEMKLGEDNTQSRPLTNCCQYALVNLNSFIMNFLLKHILTLSTSKKVHCFRKLALLLQTVPAKIRSQIAISYLKLLISFIPHLVDSIDSSASAVLFTEIVYNAICNFDLETRQLIAKKAESYLRKEAPAVFS